MNRTRELLSDLIRVGPAKPLGYLPTQTITDLCHQTVCNIRGDAQRRGLHSVEFTQKECFIGSGAVYIWSQESLQNLLTANRALLTELNWPTSAGLFVAHVANRHATDPRLNELIGRAFADPRWPKPALTK